MHPRRFFVSKDDIRDGEVSLSGQDAVHISESLRLDAGDNIIVLDGGGMEYDVLLSQVSRRLVCGKILASRACESDVRAQIGLFHALPKGAEKVSFVLRRGTEIGVSEIGFFSSARSVPRIRQNERTEEKLDRWQRVVNEAAKQCRRTTVPKVGYFPDVADVLDYCKTWDIILIAWEGETKRLRDVLKGAEKANRIAVIIGPEGGFDEAEVRLAEQRGAKRFSLGHLILRSELAGIVAASLILYEFGDLG
jgi:16S rRNA (uracil1498-N3)-methyltransferase